MRRSPLTAYDQVGQRVFCDQQDQARASAPQPLRGGTVQLHLLVDHSVIEVFAEGGETAYVVLIDPDASVTDIGLFAKGGSAKAMRLEAWPLGK
jgi:sucrose-6-phosphate hydrolase SacC (GH32 family)